MIWQRGTSAVSWTDDDCDRYEGSLDASAWGDRTPSHSVQCWTGHAPFAFFSILRFRLPTEPRIDSACSVLHVRDRLTVAGVPPRFGRASVECVPLQAPRLGTAGIAVTQFTARVNGTLLFEIVETLLIRPNTRRRGAVRNAPVAQSGCDDTAVLQQVITAPDAGRRFAANGDQNALHTSESLARSLGFRSPPLPGLLMVGVMGKIVDETMPPRSGEARILDTRWLAPAYAGRSYVIRGRTAENTMNLNVCQEGLAEPLVRAELRFDDIGNGRNRLARS